MENYLTTGEFASLCGVKKDTIFFYDEIGILTPEFITENGYRYYSINQVMIFEIITTLKAVGMSLKEIVKYSPKQNTREFLDLLKIKQDELLETQKRIADTKEFVDNTIGIIEKSLYTHVGEIIFEECEEEYLAITTTPPIDDMNDRSYWVKIEELTDYCRKYDLGNIFPIGEIVLRDKFERNIFQSDYYCSKPLRKAGGPSIWLKPAGRYAVLYQRGSYKTLPSAYQKLKEYIEKNQLKLCGEIYEQDQLYLFSKTDPNDFLMKISAVVK
jgi:Predicted transcriptional regulators